MPKPPRVAIVHIPKTAGVWLRKALEVHYEPDETCVLDMKNNGLPADLTDTLRYRLISAHMGYEYAKRLDAELVTVLRNPYDRIVSLYHFWRNVPVDHGGPALAKRLTFEEFLTSVDEPKILMSIVNVQAWQIAYGNELQQRYDRPNISPDELFGKAIENLETFAVVGVKENLPALAQSIRDKLGLNVDQNRAPENVTVARPTFNTLEFRLRAMIHPLVEVDLALYHYVLERFVFPSGRNSAAVQPKPSTSIGRYLTGFRKSA